MGSMYSHVMMGRSRRSREGDANLNCRPAQIIAHLMCPDVSGRSRYAYIATAHHSCSCRAGAIPLPPDNTLALLQTSSLSRPSRRLLTVTLSCLYFDRLDRMSTRLTLAKPKATSRVLLEGIWPVSGAGGILILTCSPICD